jgi:hypothetical protein
MKLSGQVRCLATNVHVEFITDISNRFQLYNDVSLDFFIPLLLMNKYINDIQRW